MDLNLFRYKSGPPYPSVDVEDPGELSEAPDGLHPPDYEDPEDA
jgi:hypothetical protein